MYYDVYVYMGTRDLSDTYTVHALRPVALSLGHTHVSSKPLLSQLLATYLTFNA